MTRSLLLLLALLAPAPSARLVAQDDAPTFHDPLAALARATDDAGRAVLVAYTNYDADALLAALATVEARQGTDEALPDDAYVLAQGYLELALIHRFYEKQLPERMPAALKDMDQDAIAQKGIAQAEIYAAAHPAHSDIERVHGELLSAQINGMISGMTKGPEAKRIMARAEEKDAHNGWVRFSSARMHYHNPAMAGGDKDLALKELRELQPSMDVFRVRLYLALTYSAKEMYPQARYWALKARAAAPKNPEVALLLEEIADHMGGEG